MVLWTVSSIAGLCSMSIVGSSLVDARAQAAVAMAIISKAPIASRPVRILTLGVTRIRAIGLELESKRMLRNLT